MTALAPETTTVTVPRSEIARALKAATAIKAKHVHIDLTGETAVISAYTPETAVRVTLDAPTAEPADAGFVQRATLASLVPYLDADVRISIDDKQVTFESGDSVFELRRAREGQPVQQEKPSRARRRRGDFAKAVSDATSAEAGALDHDLTTSGKRVATFEAPTLVEVLRRVLPFTSRDMTRPILANVALYPAANIAAATDSYRLAVIRYGDGPDKPADEPMLIRVAAAEALRRMLGRKLGKVTITATSRHYFVEFDDTRWSILRQVASADGTSRYPKWWLLFPDRKTDTTVKVDREDLLGASRAASVLQPRNAPLRLTASLMGGVAVSFASAERATMKRQLKTADLLGEDIEIGFNPGFLADVCRVAPVERLTVKLISPLRSALIEAARDRYLLMPIRLDV